jgi:hypothetical protein
MPIIIVLCCPLDWIEPADPPGLLSTNFERRRRPSERQYRVNRKNGATLQRLWEHALKSIRYGIACDVHFGVGLTQKVPRAEGGIVCNSSIARYLVDPIRENAHGLVTECFSVSYASSACNATRKQQNQCTKPTTFFRKKVKICKANTHDKIKIKSSYNVVAATHSLNSEKRWNDTTEKFVPSVPTGCVQTTLAKSNFIFGFN